MNWIKKIVLISLGCSGLLFSQATKILSIDSIALLDPFIMNGITNFVVSVSVNDTSAANNDSAMGVLFYYYLTDSMIDAGVPARVISPNTDTVLLNPSILDTIPIDILPNEIKTDPVNLIILWPAFMNSNPEIVDSDSVYFEVFLEGFLNTYPPPLKKHEIYYPLPALQLLYIKPEELDLIERIRIYNLHGYMVKDYRKEEFATGQLDLFDLNAGAYLVETEYKSGWRATKKITKR